MSDLVTNLNVAPYNDDYDRTKRFYKILFVPSRAVQVREINQLQTILQEQTKRHADHIFRDGSIVAGCNITHVPALSFVRLDNSYNVANNNADFSSNALANFLAVSNTGVRASVRLAKAGFELQYPDTNVLYVDYVKTGRDGGNNEVSVFTSGETITLYNTTQDKFANTLDGGKIYNTIDVFTANVAANQSSTGNTFAVSIGEGIVYQKGYFVNVLPHTITVRDYDSEVDDYLVGFSTAEDIITHLQDATLIDPADTSSRNGIGADRLRLIPTLISRERSSLTDDDDFFPIIEFSGGKPAIQNTDPEYAALGGVLADRTFEAHNDFYIKPFVVSTESSSNTSTFNYAVNPGIAYVKGNRVELLAATRLETTRAATTSENGSNIVTMNYGYYTEVKEVVGIFDFDSLNVVQIYDTAQATITDREAVGAGPTGNVIGTANIRQLVYDTGTKGFANCVYRAYLTNITMTAGFNFINNAKSIYSSTGAYGTAKADLVLDTSQAVIKDANRTSLVFPTGVDGMKRLRNSSGVNDTSFYVRDISTATLQANGLMTFTLNSPAAGGVEKFFNSVGVLSNANELRIDIATSAAVTGNSQTGTVQSQTAISGSNNVLSGTGTNTFLTQYAVGDAVRVVANTTQSYIRTITGISNNSTMTLDASITQVNATAVMGKYWEAGRIFDLTPATVTAVSNTQFTVQLANTTIASGAPQTVYGSYPVLRSEAVEIKKEARKSRYVKIDCSTAGITGPWNLGLTDVYDLLHVYVGTTYNVANPERSSWFALNTGQTDFDYSHAKLLLNPAFTSKITSGTRILVELSYFEANTTAGAGFFSVDSYPTRAPGVAANSTNISFAEIPVYAGYDLRNSIDFRPQRYNTANGLATAVADATINPAAANTSYKTIAAGAYLAESDTNFEADIEYYLPRVDLVQINKDGHFNIKSSVPSVNPKQPGADREAMPIAVAYVPPFPSLPVDEAVLYNAVKDKINVKLQGNRVYTMPDIGGLDQRITRLEYYETLNLLEAKAKDYTIKDSNGLDRFKNGIFADPFNNHLLGDYTNFEYNIALDEENSLIRPTYTTTPVDLGIASNTGTVVTSQILSLPYTAVLTIAQTFASKFRNLTESVWDWQGNMKIFPAYDHYKDTVAKPDINTTLDLTTPWDQFAATPFGKNFGDWRTVATKVNVANTSSSVTSGRSTATTTTTKTTTSSTLARTIDTLKVGSSLSSYDLGTFVTDISVNPFIRAREVAFVVSGLKPFTKFWVYFDKVAVSTHCAPGTLSTSYNAAAGVASSLATGHESEVVTRSAAWGTQLVSDASGMLQGLFAIPPSTFRVGDRELLIANVDDLVTGEDAITSAARMTYTASSSTVTTQGTNLNTINPVISSTSINQTVVKSATTITSKTSTVTIPEPTPPFVPTRNEPRLFGGRGPQDPLGQSFFVQTPAGVPGMFLNKIGVYFKAKDSTLGVTCYITEMSAGYPDTSRIVAKAYLPSSGITVSADGTSETVFTFHDLPYLTNDKFYTFFCAPDGNSPEYLIWMAELGGTDITSGQKIFSNPNIGTAFTSSNSNTWNALQTEDIKFNIYRCSFSAASGTAVFADENDDYITVNGFSLVNSAIDIQVGDLVYTQNSTGGLLTSNTDPFGRIQSFDNATDTLILDSSIYGNFANTNVIQIHRPAQTGNVSALNANTMVANATIVSTDNYDYSVIVPRFGTVTPFGTSVSFAFKGMTSAESVDSAWAPVQEETELEMIDKMRSLKSASNRVGVNNSIQFQATLSTQDSWLTPIIDLKRKSALIVKNIINNDTTNYHTRYGNATAKYVSQIIELAEGQDAEDIRVIITGYRPAETDITAYVKFENIGDAEPFYNKYWTKLTLTAGEGIYSNILDPEDYREFEYSVPTAEFQQGEAYLNSGFLTYRDLAGSAYVGFKKFAIKLVFTSTRPERVPKCRDVRAIALQK